MFLSDIFDYFLHGELSQIAIGTEGSGSIQSADYPKVITNINLGLIELYKRFPLKTAELTLQLYDNVTTYQLTSEYAVSNTASSKTPKYILDADPVEDFKDTILLITDVFNEEGKYFPLNESDHLYSLFTPTQNSLQVPYPVSDNVLSVIYRSSPVKLDSNPSDPSIVFFNLPDQFIEPLSLYVASKLITPANSEDSVSYYKKFEYSCHMIKNLGIFNSENTNNIRFGENGWL